MLPPALPRRAVLLALISDADRVRDESGRKVLDASGAEGQIEDLSLYAMRSAGGSAPATHYVIENDTSAYRVALVDSPDRAMVQGTDGQWRAVRQRRPSARSSGKSCGCSGTGVLTGSCASTRTVTSAGTRGTWKT